VPSSPEKRQRRVTLSKSMSITPRTSGRLARGRFKHGSNLSENLCRSRVTPQWKSTDRNPFCRSKTSSGGMTAHKDPSAASERGARRCLPCNPRRFDYQSAKPLRVASRSKAPADGGRVLVALVVETGR
jgi:hypothetical protein